MKIFLLIALGCVFLSGCANPVDKVAKSVESVALASTKYPRKLADKTVERHQRKQAKQ